MAKDVKIANCPSACQRVRFRSLRLWGLPSVPHNVGVSIMCLLSKCKPNIPSQIMFLIAGPRLSNMWGGCRWEPYPMKGLSRTYKKILVPP